MLACAAGVCAMAEETNQIVNAGGTVYFTANGVSTSGPLGGAGSAVVEMSKTIAPYYNNGAKVENEFEVTLNVKTIERILEISSDTPDSAVLLVMDVSNSMDDCVICGKEENHADHDGRYEPHYYCSGTSGTEYQRRSNRDRTCVHCGRYQSQHNEVRVIISAAECAYVSRLERTQIAAEDFLSEFANETGAEGDDKRMVGIIAYGSHSVNVLGYGENDTTNWVDIRTEAGMTAALEAIEGLSVANSNYPNRLEGGGTSIESALALARNILNAGASNNGEIFGIDYVYTILLTDGQPTYPVSTGNYGINSNSVEYIYGNETQTGGTTQTEDYDNANDLASAIKGLNNNGMSKLYSICFGKVDGNQVWGLTLDDNANPKQTVGQWLTSFSTAAYNAEAAQDANLFDAFNSVMNQIKLASRAWKVEDWMGDHMIMGDAVEDVRNTQGGILDNAILAPDPADYAEGEELPAFVWDILASEYDSTSTYDPELQEGVLSYTYKYRVTLDNLALGYSTTNGNENSPQNPVQAANAKATLRYAATDAQGEWPDEYITREFPVPSVQGLVGEFKFEKVDQYGEPVVGEWTFRLRAVHNEANQGAETHWDYVDAEIVDGVVTFRNIPSGHEYTLLEAEKTLPEGYAYIDAGNTPVTISWGEAIHELSDEDEDGTPELVNELTKTPPANLTIRKAFDEGSVIPKAIDFQLDKVLTETDTTPYTLTFSLDAEDTVVIDGKTYWEWTIEGLKPGNYIVKEFNAIDENNKLLKLTHDLEFKIEVTDSGVTRQVAAGIYSEGNEPTTKAGDIDLSENETAIVTFTNKMTRKEGTLSVEKEFLDAPADLPNNLTIKMTATEVADENGTALEGAVPQELTFEYANGVYTAARSLPIGYYKLEETAIPALGGYTHLNYIFKNGTIELGRNPIVQITDSATLSLALTNHYKQDTGNIHVFKVFGGSLAQGSMTDEAYEAFLNEQLGDLTITIHAKQGDAIKGTMYLSADTDWNGELNNLPIGEYTLEEIVPAVPGHTLASINWSAGSSNVTVTKDTDSRVTVTNTYDQQTGTLTVTKTFGGDLDADDFADKTIYVYVMQDDGNPNTVDLKDTLELSASNTPEWTDSVELPIGTYQLVEEISIDAQYTAHVPGYTLTPTWTMNSVTTTGNSLSNVAVTDQTTVSLGLNNSYAVNAGTLELTKQNTGDLDSMPQEIVFSIKQNGTEVERVTLSGSNMAQSISLNPGVYTVEEVLSSVPTQVSWTDNVVVDENNAALVTIEIAQTNALEVVCTNDYQFTKELTFTKLSSYNHTAIAGVEFALEHACAADACPGLPVNVPVIEPAVSDEYGVVTFENLLVGHTYTLTETKPEGYVAVEPMTVTVTDDGAFIEGTVDNMVYNTPEEWPTTTLTFTKLSSYDQSVIAGAQFDLVHNDDICCGDEIDLDPAEPDMYGKVTITGIPRMHSYILMETVVPEGYKQMAEMLITADEDGVFVVDEENDALLPAINLTVYNDPAVIPSTITLGAVKTMDGETPKDQYTFVLSINGDEIERVQNVGGEITFSPILFTEEGKTTFTITEEIGDDAKVLYDKSVYTVTVTAKKGADDVLDLDVSIDKDGNTYTGMPEFHNETMQELPATGDSSRLGLWLAVLAMGSLGIAALVKRKAVRG